MRLKFNTKAQLIDALEAVRPLCEEQDNAELAEHKKAEQEYLRTWKGALREAAKWSYKEAVDNSFRIPMPESSTRPSCPTSKVQALDAILYDLGLTHQETFTLDEDKGGYYSSDRAILRLLALGAPQVKSVC